MTKFLISVIVIVILGFWVRDFVQSGQFEKYLDSHPNPEFNPQVEYYWGMGLSMSNRKQMAAYRLSRVVEKYPKSEYAPLAWAEYIQVLDDMGDRPKVLEEAKKFLESDYASHPKAEIIRKKLRLIEHGY